MDNLNNIPNAGNWGDAASKLNDNFNKIKQSLTTVENTSKNNKGYFTSLSALNTAFPSPKAGQTAYVYGEASSTNYYIYNAVNGAWVTASIEAPPVGVDIAGYTKTGESTKTTKEVEDEIVQLGGDVRFETARLFDINSSDNEQVFASSSDFINEGYIQASDGVIVNISLYKYSDYFMIYPYIKISLTGFVGSATVAKIDYYDKNKNRIPSPEASNDEALQSIAPSNAYYCRFCYNVNSTNPIVRIVDTLSMRITKEEAVSDFNHISLAKALRNSISLADEIMYGSEWTNAGYITPDGNVIVNSLYVHSDYIGVIPFQEYALEKMSGYASVAKVSFYDYFKKIIPNEHISINDINFTVTVPSTAKYVRFCYAPHTDGVPNPIATVSLVKAWQDNALRGLYVPVNQLNHGHELVNARSLPWLFTGYRTKAFKDIITNIIKVPIQADTPQAFDEYRLLIASSESVTTPSLMRDVTDQIDTISFAVTDNTFSVIKMKTPLFLAIGEVVVFMWKKADEYRIRGNINPDLSTDNKLQFLYSDTGQTDWNEAMSVSALVGNLTPAMVFLMDEKYEEQQVVDTWSPRRNNVIATMEDFQNLSGATKQNEGWSILGTGSFVRNLIFDVETYMERIKMTASFKIEELSSGLVSFSFGKFLNSETYGEIRITEGFFQLWNEYSGEGATKYYEQALTGINMSVGTELVLSISKIADSVTFSVTDGITTISKTVLKTENERMCLMHAMPYVGITTGRVFVKNVSVSSDYDPVYSKIGMWGDSFFEGSSMVSSGLENRYCAKLADAVGDLYCPIFGRGGRALEESFFNEFKNENEWFRPKYVFVGLGTNNPDFNSYSSYVLRIVNHVKSKNQIPVLVTVTPRPGREAFISQANPFIRSLGERYVDMNKAVTVEGDDNTWKDGYVFGDLTHPTTAGHAAMFERIKIDVPELFEV